MSKFNNVKRAINDVPFPSISRDAWMSNLGSVSDAYEKDELSDIWHHNETTTQLYQIKQHLWYLESESTEAGRDVGSSQPVMYLVSNLVFFESDAGKLAKRFRELIENIFGKRAIDFHNLKNE